MERRVVVAEREREIRLQWHREEIRGIAVVEGGDKVVVADREREIRLQWHREEIRLQWQ